jgi:hypothetical protein
VGLSAGLRCGASTVNEPRTRKLKRRKGGKKRNHSDPWEDENLYPPKHALFNDLQMVVYSPDICK